MSLIYCVEDDAGIRELVVYALGANGFEAQGFEEAESFRQAMRSRRPALVLLDIMLPGEDGLSILRWLRHQDAQAVPVILLTAKTNEYDRVVGLDLGADDYICKPFGVMELISRVKAVLRRAAPVDQTLLQLGEISLSSAGHTVSVSGADVALTHKEFELLHCLMQNRGLVMTREKLLERVWNYDFEGESRTVDVHIGSLRQKLGAAGTLIETIRGVGYRMGGSQ